MNWYLEKFAAITGRATRAEFWYFFLFNFIAVVVLGVIGVFIGTKVFGTIYSIGVLIPAIAVGVRRMHDVGKSGWFLLIPFYNLLLAAMEGQVGPNEYGPDPKNPDAGVNIADHLVD